MAHYAFALIATLGIAAPTGAAAGPSAEVAKKCMHFSYLAYPYRRPGSVKMSSDRQSYFKDCMSKEGNVLEPSPPKEQ
ncbi:hypothetical protein ACVIIW_003658 [Bradyrhizobium sp. USDA 4449]